MFVSNSINNIDNTILDIFTQFEFKISLMCVRFR